MKVIIDTSILMDFLNNQKSAVDELSKRDSLAVSIVSYIEILNGIKDVDAQVGIRQFFKQFEIVNIDSKIAEEAIRIKMLRKISFPNALILATAVVNNVALLTRDETIKKHPNVKCPY